MKKFIIQWNTGYGDNYDIVETVDKEEADKFAYEIWRQEAEDQSDYSAEPYSKEKAEDLGIE